VFQSPVLLCAFVLFAQVHRGRQMRDQKFDDLVKQVQAVEIEITRCDATIRALWAELTRLGRLGIAASKEYEHLVEAENERNRWILLRERIQTTLASVGG
jgi:hypothetical protein